MLADIKALGGKGGMIAVAPNGDAAWGFTTPAMYRGMADAERPDRRDLLRGRRAVGQVPPQPFDLGRDAVRSASRKSATASRKPRFGMKCAELVITGS